MPEYKQIIIEPYSESCSGLNGELHILTARDQYYQQNLRV